MILNLLTKLWRGLNKKIVRMLPAVSLGARPIKVDWNWIGSGDGSWPVPKDWLDGNSLCYCFGVGLDISFDVGLHDTYQCPVFSFDPTPSSIEFIKSKDNLPIEFKPWGVWKEDTTLSLYPQKKGGTVNLSTINPHRGKKVCDIVCYRLQTIMKMLHHNKVDLIKIDIEGAWLGVIEDMVMTGIIPRIVCVEFDSPTSFWKVRKAMRLLNSVGLRYVFRSRDDYLFVHTSEL